MIAILLIALVAALWALGTSQASYRIARRLEDHHLDQKHEDEMAEWNAPLQSPEKSLTEKVIDGDTITHEFPEGVSVSFSEPGRVLLQPCSACNSPTPPDELAKMALDVPMNPKGSVILPVDIFICPSCIEIGKDTSGTQAND